MEFIRQWLLGIITTALLLALLLPLIPQGKLRQIGQLAGSLILALAVLRPLDNIHLSWNLGYEEYADRIQRTLDRLEEENRSAMEKIIAERTAAYIADKGCEWGVPCHPTVMTRWENGVPYPVSVVMDIPFHAELAKCIDEELGIPGDCQTWQER